jgi:histidinol-phosphate transaminase
MRMKDCYNSYPVDAVAQAVCTAAVKDTAYYEAATKKVVAERERLQTSLRAMGFTVPESASNFLFAGRAAADGKTVYQSLRAEGVLVRFWDKPLLRDFVRITVGTPEQNDVLLEKLKKILS